MKHIYFLFLLITALGFAQLTPPANLQSYYSGVDFNKTGINLKDDLSTVTISKHTNFLSYSNVWESSKVTDEDPNNNANVLLIYGYNDSGNITEARSRNKDLNGGNNGDWNREHVYAKSLGTPDLGTSGPGSDGQMLRPSDVQRNGQRANLKFATGTGNSKTVNSGSYWYPGDEWKGDVARIAMYMYLRYGSQCLPSNLGVGSSASTPDDMIDLFLQWNIDDPVSIIEDNRNTYHGNTFNTYAQGNRNPFIDNPYLATVIWGGSPAQNRWSALSTNNFSIDNFSIYPNPTNGDVLNISNTTASTNLSVEIFNILGKSVLKQKLLNNSKNINISQLNKGMYLVKLISDTCSATKKFIKN